MATVLTLLAICILYLGYTCIVIMQYRRHEHEMNPWLEDDIDLYIDRTRRRLRRLLHGDDNVMDYRRRWDE